jgi:aromatic-L-amino-acid decarboxylase
MGIVPEFRGVLDGCGRADSFIVNPHKWLFTPMDCSALYVRDTDTLRAVFSLVPPYLMTPEDGHARNLMDYGPAMGRRFRALKLWMVIRYFGVKGMVDRVREHVELARRFAGWIDEASDWERLAPVPMSLVLYRHRPPGIDDAEKLDTINTALLERVNREGKVFLSHTQVDGIFALRLAIGNVGTQQQHVEEAWEALRRAAREMRDG